MYQSNNPKPLSEASLDLILANNKQIYDHISAVVCDRNGDRSTEYIVATVSSAWGDHPDLVWLALSKMIAHRDLILWGAGHYRVHWADGCPVGYE
jgi:hypothetical protein